MNQPRNPRYQSRAPMRVLSTEEFLFSQVVQCCERLQRQGMPITKETLEHQIEAIEAQLTRANAYPTGPELEEILASDKLQYALEMRGISYTPTQLVTPEQYAAAAIYMDTTHRATHAQRLKMAGVTQRRWDGWMAQPRFAALIQELSEERLAAAIPMAHQRLLDAVDKGEQWAIKMLYEITGRFNSAQPGQDPVALVMTVYSVLEQAKVDPEVMAKVGEAMRTAALSGATAARTPGAMMTLTQSTE